MARLNRAATTAYAIDGFRSLRDFHLALEPGLNVLVGPNGSGKTNFLDFLGFLDNALHVGATNAISSAGGLARVFSQENTKRHSAHLVAKVSGLANLADVIGPFPPNPFFFYEYQIELKFSREHSAVYISHEVLRLKKLHLESDEPFASVRSGKIEIRRRGPAPEDIPRWELRDRIFADNDRNPMAATDRGQRGSEPPSIEPRLRALSLAPDQSILSAGGRFGFPAIEAVRLAITRGRSFNLQPEKSRVPDDVSKIAGIARDGSGLTATLHALQVMRKGTPRRNLRVRLANKDTMAEIIEWTKLVFPDLEDITVSQDPHTGKYLAYLMIGKDPPLRLPLQAASDGTLKWLCLIVLILAVGGIYSIEEPENFLHPKMQQFLVDLMRDSVNSSSRGAYFIFSTHSETMINFVHPSEIVIFDFHDNSTRCARVDNPESVMEEINRTGFGLGYYYASNSLPANFDNGRRDDGEAVCKQ